MLSKLMSLVFITATALTFGCNKSAGFTESRPSPGEDRSEDVRSGFDNPQVQRDPLELFVRCPVPLESAPEVERGRDVAKFRTPMVCSGLELRPPTPGETLNLFFVLDVTGSMGPHLEVIRAGFAEGIQRLRTQGWNLRVGALAFEDKVIDEISLTEDAHGVLARMSPVHEAWRAPPGFGGDVPEIGLGAIERGLEIMNAGQTSSTAQNIMVYVSDAPARRVHMGGFSVVETAQRLGVFKKNIESRGGSFLFFFSSSRDRRGLFDEMPTPAEQIDQLIAASGVKSVNVGFPLTAIHFNSRVVERAGEGKWAPVQCALKDVRIRGGHVGERDLGVSTESRSDWKWEVRDLEKGTYELELLRDCGGREMISKVPVQL